MRVILAVDDLMRGGTQLQTLRTANALAERGAKVAVLSLRQPEPTVATEIQQARERGVAIRQTPAHLFPAVVRHHRPDVVVGTMSRSNVLSVVAGRRARIPSVVSRRSLVSTRSDNPAFAAMRKWSIRHADAVIANSEAVADDVAASEAVPRAAIHVVENIVEAPPPDASAPPWFPADPVIVSIGMMRAVKGQDVLLDALHLLHGRSVRYAAVIAGDGPLRASIANRVRGLPVILPGWVDRPYDLLCQACVYVQPSRSESRSNALLEAVAAGVPVVATDVGDTRRLLGDSGYLVSPGNPWELADGLQLALREQRPPSNHCLSMMTASAVAERYLTLFESLGAHR